MKLLAKYSGMYRDEEDNAFIKFKIDYRFMHLFQSLEKKEFSLEIKEIKRKRSLQQNNYMWALLHEIAEKIGFIDEYDIYVIALEKANAKFEYIACVPNAEEQLKKEFRAIKFVKRIDLNGKEGNMYKVFIGSSKMNTQEMTRLIDVVLEIAEQSGVENLSYWQGVLK